MSRHRAPLKSTDIHHSKKNTDIHYSQHKHSHSQQQHFTQPSFLITLINDKQQQQQVGSLDEERETELLVPLLERSFLATFHGPALLFGEGETAGAAFVLMRGKAELRKRLSLPELGSANVDRTVKALNGEARPTPDAGFVLGGELLGASLEQVL